MSKVIDTFKAGTIQSKKPVELVDCEEEETEISKEILLVISNEILLVTIEAVTLVM
ncbi:MAG: hypothetical protein GYA02_15545 [Clostridiaceae bacterium]|jgi:hypothetical protein|nr:hypothetical protein [Clostridiaceae bacterium]